MGESAGHKGGRRGYKNKGRSSSFGGKSTEVLTQLDDTNPVVQMFKTYRDELDDRHDRHERIIKASRDITIESKRIIFLLHSAGTATDEKRKEIYEEAGVRLRTLTERHFKTVAVELEGHDPFQYIRAFSAGTQEFVEASLFHAYLTTATIKPPEPVKYDREEKETITFVVPPVEFVLGLADFTGELMRKCINNLGSGDIDDCFRLCNFVRQCYAAFLGVSTAGHKELGHKLYVLKQSLSKMEYVCYSIRMRGSEVPKHLLGDIINPLGSIDVDDDEGFY